MQNKVVGSNLVTYTCTSISEKNKVKHGIVEVGPLYGFQLKEVLLIPLSLFKGGLSSDPNLSKIQSEQLISSLSR